MRKENDTTIYIYRRIIFIYISTVKVKEYFVFNVQISITFVFFIRSFTHCRGHGFSFTAYVPRVSQRYCLTKPGRCNFISFIDLFSFSRFQNINIVFRAHKRLDDLPTIVVVANYTKYYVLSSAR